MSNNPTPTTNASRPYSNTSSQQEREEILRAEARANTYAGRAITESNVPLGRFTEISKRNVIGATPTPEYPDAPTFHDPVPPEPSLGIDITAVEPVGESWEVEKSLVTAAPHPPADVERPQPSQSKPKRRLR